MNNERTYSCIKSYTLIAQTPLIHFQHDQEGATLRASEVKPKLDAFLRSKAEQRGIDIRSRGWTIKETAALNYKLRLVAIDREGNPIQRIRPISIGKNTPYDIYYGNMGDDTPEVKAVKTDVKMTVICGISELMGFITENLTAFFIVTNFGRMQSKGFGSYIIKDEEAFYDDRIVSETLTKEYGAKRVYYFSGGSENQIFKRIKVIYTLMKSGSIFSKPPSNSLLFQYLNDKGIVDERTWLKKEVVARPSRQRVKYRYVRALLGVGDHIDLKKPVSASVKISNGQIERLASPILFKVFPDHEGKLWVYFVPRRIHDSIYGAEFTFSSNRGTGYCCVPTEDELKTQSGEDFIDDFLDFCYNEFNKTDILDRFADTKNLYVYIGGKTND